MKRILLLSVLLFVAGCSAADHSDIQETPVPSVSPEPAFQKSFSVQFPNEMVLDWAEGDADSSFDVVVVSILPPKDVLFVHAMSPQGVFQAIGFVNISYCNENELSVSGDVVSFKASATNLGDSDQCFSYFIEIQLDNEEIAYRTWKE